MRVAVLTRDYPPAVGGIATHVEGLVKALRDKGVDVDLFVGTHDVKTLLLPFDMPLKRYDLVHVQSLPYGAFVFGVPLVVTVHSPVLEEFDHYRDVMKLASFPAIALEKMSLFKAKAVLAVSDQSKEDLTGAYGLDEKDVEVIGNGVDYQRFAGPRAPADPASEKRVLVVSRLEPRKNVEEAIDAIAELPKGACELEIVGDGSEMESLLKRSERARAEGSVHFLGRVDGTSLPEVYARSAIFLTTSRSEGFGLSLLEAMASGCACVASDIPTHRALIRHGETGLLYGRRAELVSSLQELLSSPDKAERMGRAAREAASSHTWAKVAERVKTAYEGVVSDKAPGTTR